MVHRDYISQAPKVRVRPRMLKKLNFWTIFKKKEDILRDWKSSHCPRKQSYIIIEKNKKLDLFYNVFFRHIQVLSYMLF